MQQNSQYSYHDFMRDMISNGTSYTSEALEVIYNYISNRVSDNTVFNMNGKDVYDYVTENFDEFTFDHLRNKIYNTENRLAVKYFDNSSEVVDRYIIDYMKDCFYTVIGYGQKCDDRTMIIAYC